MQRQQDVICDHFRKVLPPRRRQLWSFSTSPTSTRFKLRSFATRATLARHTMISFNTVVIQYDVIILDKWDSILMLVINVFHVDKNVMMIIFNTCQNANCDVVTSEWSWLVILKILHLGQDGRDQHWSLGPGGGWTLILRCSRYKLEVFTASIFQNLLE